MATPLYKTVIENTAECDEKGNKGLWFDRFFDQYDENKWDVLKPQNNDTDKGNTYWLIKHFHNKNVGDDAQLTSHSTQQQHLAKGLQGNSHIFSANWHFVTGLGNPHPVENGFAWHPTLGVPYLTGAAVKGIVRNYIENYLDESEENRKDLLLNWFGSTSKDPSADGYISETGNIIFFDALPIEPVTLVVDIMTPHMGDWYQKGAENAGQSTTVPADWHDPIPVTFLACKNISLQFSYALRQYPKDEKYTPKAIELDDVKTVLTQALEHLGAGGKTATGYGSMRLDDKREAQIAEEAKELEQASALKNMSEEERSLYELKALLTSDKEKKFKQAGCQTSNRLNELLQTAQNWKQSYKSQMAVLAEEIYNWHGWGPKKKRPNKQKILDDLRLDS